MKSRQNTSFFLKNRVEFPTETARSTTVRRSMAAICLCLGLILLWPRAATADAVTDWNANAGRAAVAACISPGPGDDPLHESRRYAMMHVAVHDALNAIDRRSRPYAFDASVAPEASANAAVASAARHV